MKYIALILTLAGIVYMLSLWLSGFENEYAPESGETVVSPIKDAENIKALMEARNQ